MSKHNINNRRIAFLVTDGFEQSELVEPWRAVEAAGGTPELVSPKPDHVLGMHHFDHGTKFKVTVPLSTTDADGFDGLVLPGGLGNPDELRQNREAVAFVRDFFRQHKPVAAICHAPWTLVEAGVVENRTLTSWPSLRTDIENAGGRWVDEECHVDHGLVTSRNPGDLPAFCAKAIEEFAEGKHRGQTA